MPNMDIHGRFPIWRSDMQQAVWDFKRPKMKGLLDDSLKFEPSTCITVDRKGDLHFRMVADNVTRKKTLDEIDSDALEGLFAQGQVLIQEHTSAKATTVIKTLFDKIDEKVIAAMTFVGIHVVVKDLNYTTLEYLEKQFVPNIKAIRDECVRAPACRFQVVAVFRSRKELYHPILMEVEIDLKTFEETWKDIEELLKEYPGDTSDFTKEYISSCCWENIFDMCTPFDERTGERIRPAKVEVVGENKVLLSGGF